MNSSALPLVAGKRHSTIKAPVQVKPLSNSQHMPFAWCIQANQAPVQTEQRAVVVMNCPPETYLG